MIVFFSGLKRIHLHFFKTEYGLWSKIFVILIIWNKLNLSFNCKAFINSFKIIISTIKIFNKDTFLNCLFLFTHIVKKNHTVMDKRSQVLKKGYKVFGFVIFQFITQKSKLIPSLGKTKKKMFTKKKFYFWITHYLKLYIRIL